MTKGSTLGENWTTDHIIPLSKGGTEERYNRVKACKACNSMKGNLLLEEWLAQLERRGDDWRAQHVRRFIAARQERVAAE